MKQMQPTQFIHIIRFIFHSKNNFKKLHFFLIRFYRKKIPRFKNADQNLANYLFIIQISEVIIIPLRYSVRNLLRAERTPLYKLEWCPKN